jgi:indolepyruvate ferredoxin oxidoreductase
MIHPHHDWAARMKHSVTLDDKYQVEVERVFLTGTQAIVRLPLLQRALDVAAGRNTAGFISGYRGSPLGSVDIQCWAAREQLAASHIQFRPGVNEDMAATAIWGTQQVALLPGAKYDGVFSLWYGKGPGVDRSGDVLKHGNFAGTSRGGGVLVAAGDDHACKSSTVPHQSEPALSAALIPVLVPADVREILEYGLHGWAMSRWSGRWIGFKTVADVVDTSATVAFALDRFRILPPDGAPPDVHIRLNDPPMEQEARVHALGLPAAQDYVRANGLDRIVLDPPGAGLGIITFGKSYHDTRQALADLGNPPVRLLKLALAWPVEPRIVRRFAAGLAEIIVVEEKSAFVERQVRDILYDMAERPRVLGRQDDTGAALLRSGGELSADDIALALARRLPPSDSLVARRAFLERQAEHLARTEVAAARKPYFCSGCPHNTSTKVIDGSRALAGIGCHYMAQWMDRSTAFYSQMGGEGVAWIGQSPFTEETHVFANIGDGTYFHSGILAVRASAAAGVNVTYKLLFNDAVAMTGGQPVEGHLTVPQITRQLEAEGVVKIAVVTDEPEKHAEVTDFAPGVAVHHRRDLQEVERALRDTPGVTAIVYDQTCASEKRRRRKRGSFPDPQKRAFINTAVCEGCGDCSATSNCLSVVPHDTPLGTKRRIDQSSCNKDFSCVEGFCPSFVTVHGGSPRKRARVTPDETALPEPAIATLDQPWSMLVTGVGGTGIVTIGALLGMAAHIEDRHISVLDVTGMAQKGGSVWSNIRIAADADALHGLHVGRGRADVLLACDMVVSAARDTLATLRQGVSRVVLNTHESPTADFVLDRDFRLPSARLRRAIVEAAGAANVEQLDATAIAAALLGDAIAGNLLLLGYAWQQGLVPLRRDSLLRAIEMNGTAVEANKAAFAWGRCAAANLPRVLEAAGLSRTPPAPRSLDDLIAGREAHLTGYQSRRYARRYRRLIDRVRETEGRMFSGSTALTEAVAHNYAKLLAYKDEYEVARLYGAPEFAAALAEQFDGATRIDVHLAPPLLARRDRRTGHLVKRAYGPWVLRAFRVLAPLRAVRGTWFDPFGHTEERRAERRLIAGYEADIEEILRRLAPATLATAVALAGVPDRIRGYGHVKDRAMREAAVERARLLDKLRGPAAPVLHMAAE